jgi:hypothetical protein
MALSRVGYGYYGAIVHSSTAKPWEQGYYHRKSVSQSLITHLIDPKTKDELLILGTSNISTVNAFKTLNRAKAFNATSVLLQVSPVFSKFSQGKFQDSKSFQSHLKFRNYQKASAKSSDIDNGFKSWIFRYRAGLLYFWLNTMMRTPKDIWRLFYPGLDYKLVHDLAVEQNLDLHFAGEDFDGAAMTSLKGETRMDLIYPFLKYYFNLNDSWESEAKNMQVLFRSHELKAIAEGHFTQDNVAWCSKFLEKLLPHQKKILIDKRDEEIFWAVEKKMKGNRKLVLVNQWHMDGIQRYWRKFHGLEPARGPLLSTHDLPLEEVQNWMRGIDSDREVVEKRTSFPMASHSKDLTPYWDETRSHYG